MKKVITFLTTLFLCSGLIYSQTFEFYRNGILVQNNETIEITDVEENAWGWLIMKSKVQLKNTTSNTVEASLSQTVLEHPAAGELEVCFGGNCYASTNANVTWPGTIAPGMPDNEDEFKMVFYPSEEIYTHIKVQYDVFVRNNPDDKTTIFLIFNYRPGNINIISQNDNLLIYNQNGQICFKFNNSSPKRQLTVYNITGTETGQYKADSELLVLPETVKKGVYLYSVKENGKVVSTGKYIHR